MGNFKMQKINQNIKKILSQIIENIVSEEISFVTVNFISTTKDLKLCKVYLGFINNNKEISFNKFKKYISQIKKEFSKKSNIRYTPIFEFYIDKKQEEIDKVEKLLHKIRKK